MNTHQRVLLPGRLLSMAQRARCGLERVPYSALALPLRLGAALVFWNSAMTKLDDWNATLVLFRDEYRVPLLAPETAALLSLSLELVMPILLVTGLFTRLACLGLLGMTLVIEVFVYPQAWATHLQWAAMLFVLLSRGAGNWSLDRLLVKRRSQHDSGVAP